LAPLRLLPEPLSHHAEDYRYLSGQFRLSVYAGRSVFVVVVGMVVVVTNP
jgi:hypothetical protein